eukprot:567780-Rhodomonas_salina.2
MLLAQGDAVCRTDRASVVSVRYVQLWHGFQELAPTCLALTRAASGLCRVVGMLTWRFGLSSEAGAGLGEGEGSETTAELADRFWDAMRCLGLTRRWRGEQGKGEAADDSEGSQAVLLAGRDKEEEGLVPRRGRGRGRRSAVQEEEEDVKQEEEEEEEEGLGADSLLTKGLGKLGGKCGEKREGGGKERRPRHQAEEEEIHA